MTTKTDPVLPRFSQCPPARLVQVRGIAFDVDDTVTEHGKLSTSALAAMHALRADGVRLIAVTGRPLGWCDVFVSTLPIDAAVGENGAAFVDAELREAVLADRESSARVLRTVRERAGELGLRLTRDAPHRRYDTAFDIGEHQAVSEETIAKLERLIVECGARSMRSTVHVHAAVGDYDKGKGAIAAIRHLEGISTEHSTAGWLFVGDSPNDAPAFGTFDLSVGVANIQPFLSRIPSLPSFVTEAARGRGFAQVADAVMLARAHARESA